MPTTELQELLDLAEYVLHQLAVMLLEQTGAQDVRINLEIV